MQLEPLCRLDLRYTEAFRLARPYGNECGSGWGRGDGVVSGDRLAGAAAWSNHPTRRGDGAMLPDARGVITTATGAEVLFDLTGRTAWVERDGHEVGRQLVTVLFESEHPAYAWLNQALCVGEGVIDPVTLTALIDVALCVPEM